MSNSTLSDLTEHTPETHARLPLSYPELTWDADSTRRSVYREECRRALNELAAYRALGSVAELQSLIAIGRKVQAMKPARWDSPPDHSQRWDIVNDGWVDGFNTCLDRARAAGVVEQQGDAR